MPCRLAANDRQRVDQINCGSQCQCMQQTDLLRCMSQVLRSIPVMTGIGGTADTDLRQRSGFAVSATNSVGASRFL
jgi:hypothetical protein